MDLPLVIVRLRHGRERSVLNRHPWLFSGAIAGVEGDADGGSPVALAEVLDAEGRWLARGVFHSGAELAVRLYTWCDTEIPGPALCAERIRMAIRRREEHLRVRPMPDTTAFRLVYAEADGLSGLVVDRYADALSVRVTAKAMEVWLDDALAALSEATGIERRIVRADPEAAEREGVDAAAVAARSRGDGKAEFLEHGARFEADLSRGQKTGFFLDQRDNRQRVAAWAAGRRLLSAYCYTGAFEVHAAARGAREIVGLDASEAALETARRHHEWNGATAPVEYRAVDVPMELRRFRDAGRTFDMVVLDPPRFVFQASQKDRGLRGYKDINLLAMKLLTPGGILATFSCSGLVSGVDFAAMLRWAAADAGREVRVIERLGQPFDHPVLATFPESEYLKGCLCRVD